jgi:hypothetical protein
VQTSRGLYVGALGTAPDPDDVHIDGSINKSTALGARAYRSTVQSIASSTLVALSWDTQVYDTDGIFTPTSTQLKPTHEGYYQAGGSWELSSSQVAAAARMFIAVRKNGSVYLEANENHTISGVTSTVGVSTGMFYMNGSTDYIEIVVYHVMGAAKNASAATASNQHYNCGWIARIP